MVASSVAAGRRAASTLAWGRGVGLLTLRMRRGWPYEQRARPVPCLIPPPLLTVCTHAHTAHTRPAPPPPNQWRGAGAHGAPRGAQAQPPLAAVCVQERAALRRPAAYPQVRGGACHIPLFLPFTSFGIIMPAGTGGDMQVAAQHSTARQYWGLGGCWRCHQGGCAGQLGWHAGRGQEWCWLVWHTPVKA